MKAIIKEKTGKVYGFWTILSFHRIDSHGDARWWCKCNLCGDKHSVRGYTLRNGQSTKCFSCARRMR
jgi:hypothetical protein